MRYEALQPVAQPQQNNKNFKQPLYVFQGPANPRPFPQYARDNHFFAAPLQSYDLEPQQ
jgi:hypothetical protein